MTSKKSPIFSWQRCLTPLLAVSSLGLASCMTPKVPVKPRGITPPVVYRNQHLPLGNIARIVLQAGWIPLSVDGQPVEEALQRLAAQRDVTMAKLATDALTKLKDQMKKQAGQGGTTLVTLQEPPLQSVEWHLPAGHHEFKFAKLSGKNVQGSVEFEADLGTAVQYGLLSSWSTMGPNVPAMAEAETKHETVRHRCKGGGGGGHGYHYVPYPMYYGGGPTAQSLGIQWVFFAERDKSYPQKLTGGWRNAKAYKVDKSADALTAGRPVLDRYFK